VRRGLSLSPLVLACCEICADFSFLVDTRFVKLSPLEYWLSVAWLLALYYLCCLWPDNWLILTLEDCCCYVWFCYCHIVTLLQPYCVVWLLISCFSTLGKCLGGVEFDWYLLVYWYGAPWYTGTNWYQWGEDTLCLVAASVLNVCTCTPPITWILAALLCIPPCHSGFVMGYSNLRLWSYSKIITEFLDLLLVARVALIRSRCFSCGLDNI
jgi:hypothetical protein